MGVKAGQIYKISHNFEDWNLNDPNPGRQEFFQMIMSALENNESGYATFNIGVPMDAGMGGYFTNKLCLDMICLPDIVKVDEANHLITFTDQVPHETDNHTKEHEEDEDIYTNLNAEEAFSVFVHEACHFLHFSRDKGEFMSPLMKGKQYSMNDIMYNMKLRREAEFEAGYRSMFYDKIYKLYPGSRQILETNLINMMNYDKPNQTDEWKKAWNTKIRKFFDNAVDDNGNIVIGDDGKPMPGKLVDFKGLEEFTQSLRNKVQKFSEWADPKHVIEGVI